jgi:phosphoglucosamine mutase
MLETALAAGICAMGGRVMLCGSIPTPAVAHLTQSLGADAGVVISASHNPFADNGIKLFGADGYKLPDADELELERLLGDDLLDHGATGAAVGRAERIENARGRYIAHAKNAFPKALSLDGLRIVVDTANGAAFRVAPQVLTELGADVVTSGGEPDGTNINADCGALHPAGVASEVVRSGAHLGIALDGDADRVIFVDEQGSVVDGDAIMALCATRMLRLGQLSARTLVTTVMSNMGLDRAVAAAGGRVVRTSVGDRSVVAEMRRGGYDFGGEQSGHLIFAQHGTTGDGIVAALQVLAVMVQEQRALSELSRVMQRVPQVLHNIELTQRRALDEMQHLTLSIRVAEEQLGRDGRVLVRWSGTEAKLRLMVEGPEPELLNGLVAELADAARRDIAAHA